jgi:hypothetical protein
VLRRSYTAKRVRWHSSLLAVQRCCLRLSCCGIWAVKAAFTYAWAGCLFRHTVAACGSSWFNDPLFFCSGGTLTAKAGHGRCYLRAFWPAYYVVTPPLYSALPLPFFSLLPHARHYTYRHYIPSNFSLLQRHG